MAMQNLASTYSARGRRNETFELQEELLALYRKVNGAEHPRTLAAMNNPARFY
jgi:hypothetical protein